MAPKKKPVKSSKKKGVAKKTSASKTVLKSASKSGSNSVSNSAAKAKVSKKIASKKTAPKKSAKKAVKKVGKKAASKSAKKPVVLKKPTLPAELLPAGAPAPDFSLMSDEGTTVSLSHFSGKKVILYFYPKDDTPGCTLESCNFRDSFARVQGRGAIVLGVSKDSVKSHQKFKAKYSLPFPLLSDESGKMIEAYGVWKEKSMYGKTFMGIDRTTYLIHVDYEGKATIDKVYPKVKVEGHVDEILQDLG